MKKDAQLLNVLVFGSVEIVRSMRTTFDFRKLFSEIGKVQWKFWRLPTQQLTAQTALYPHRYPHQHWSGLHGIVRNCLLWLQDYTGLYMVYWDLRSLPGSSPVSRTTEPLRNQGFRFLYVRKYPNRTQTIPNHAIFSMKACILFDDSRRIVSVTCPYRSRVNAAE